MKDLIDFAVSLYGGLPVWSIWIFWVALVIVVSSVISLLIVAVRAHIMYVFQNENRRRRAADAASTEAEYLWVFMVPSLNEEQVIADSVGRLSEVQVTHKRILVINDGSDDNTGAVLENLDYPELTVLTRVLPNARQGKSEALNDAWRYLHSEVLGKGRYQGWDTRKVIVVIVDADGRLDKHAARIAVHFADNRIGGVQSQVRIYNRNHPLTFAQDLEFGIFGSVFQLGRMGWGTSNMGGNGQFNRLAALDDVVVTDSRGASGPWAEGRLTEDQDIGLRMMLKGWRGAQASTVSIHQQGVSSLRRLYRQRTRWSQGAWQVLDLIWPSLKNKNISFIARWDQLWYLLIPVIQSWVGISVMLTVVFIVTGLGNFELNLATLIVLYLLAVLPGIIGVFSARRRRGLMPFLTNILLSHFYVLYSLIIFPVVFNALLRQITGKQTWAKTSREPIENEPAEISKTET